VAGEVYLAQNGLQPTLVFDQAGTFLRTVQPPPVEGVSSLALFHPLADGSFMALRPPQGIIPRGDEWTENASFYRIPVTGAAERVVTVPALRLARVPSSVQPVGFGPVLGFAFGSDRLLAGFPDQFDIGEYGPDGALLRRIRRTWQPEPVPPAMAQGLRDTLFAMLDNVLDLPDDAQELREQPESQIRELTIASTLPAHGRLLLDHVGYLWVERVPPPPVVISGPFPVRAEPTPWDIFDPAGVWLGTVPTPADTHVLDVSEDGVAGIMRSGGTERAVLFRLDRGSTLLNQDRTGN
jgi:hypothetical protein